MKNLKIYIGAFAVLAFAASCKKSFLDEQPNEKVSTTQEQNELKNDPQLLNARVSGLYTTMYEDFTGAIATTTQNHDDFGQKGYDIYSDMLSGDMVLGSLTYGWYGGIEKYTDTRNNTSAGDSQPYRYYFRVIYAANTIIDFLGGNDAVLTNTDSKHYMGQAKAMRAYAYFYLANLYSPVGYGSGNEKILPLYTSAKQINLPQSTSAQVWDLMVKDLDQATTLLRDFDRPDKTHIDTTVARGLLSYVLAARGTNADLTRVVTLTDSVLQDYPLTTNQEAVAFLGTSTTVNPGSGFNNIATPSWIWGADITLSSSLDLVSWWGQIDVYTYSYAWAGDAKYIDADLYAAINANDIRKRQFVNSTSYKGLIPSNKFFNEERKTGGQRNITDDYIYMRADEMQLLNAEAYARLNQDGLALISLRKLTDLRTNGVDLYTLTGLAGDALKQAIYLQTRIELWGEGKSYLSLKRNKLSVTKGPNHGLVKDQIGVTIPYSDARLTFVTPSGEFLYNPNLTK